MQAGARSIHPAREDPLHLALQRDLVDLDKGVGVGGFGGRPRVAGAGFHPQRAELHGLADILVEIDDAAGDLVEAREARLLVGDLGGRRLGHDLVARLQGCRRLRHALGLTLARRNPGSALPGGGALATPGCAGLRRLRPRCPAGCPAERRSFRAAAPTAATGSFRAVRRPAPAAAGSGSATAGRAAIPALPRRRRAVAARAVADCRGEWRPAAAAEDRKRYCRSARAPAAQARLWWRPPGPQNRSGQWFETSRGFKRRIGLAT